MLKIKTLIMAAFAFCLILGEAMADESKNKLLLEVSTERFELRLYGQQASGIFQSAGWAKGPQLLKKSGELKSLIRAIQPELEVLDLSGDRSAYTLDLKFSVPQEEIAQEVIGLILERLGYTGQREQLERHVIAISIADLERAQQTKQEKLPANAKAYSTTAMGGFGFYGYQLSEVLSKLNEKWEEILFVLSGEEDERVGLEFSGLDDLDQVVAELQAQGLGIAPQTQVYEPLVIRK